ncbi:hypothetical protein QQX98_006265 [Neonectria punicea]|uniref:F-box domain-containing protein n=1 Tax=Neonectria punicea TaxID=979145 RepID=A0ABR1H1G2_9HYPO
MSHSSYDSGIQATIPMAPLVPFDLPEEILRLICAQLCAHCSPKSSLHSELPPLTRSPTNTKALIRLSKTCRHFYHIARPFIYHDFVPRPQRQSQVKDFLRTICANRTLATHVRRLAIYNDFSFPGEHRRFVKEEAAMRGILHAVGWDPPIDKATGEIMLDPLEGLNSYRFAVGLFLDTTPNIEQLYLETYALPQDTMLPPSTHLPALKVLHLTTDMESAEPLSLEPIKSIFEKAPNLEYLELNLWFSGSISWALGNLRWLKLKDSILGLHDLHTLATACHKLETFVFHTSLVDEQVPALTQSFLPSNIQQGLLPCKSTLRHLEIQCNWETIRRHPQHELITSLKEFPFLESLVLSAACIGFVNHTQQRFDEPRPLGKDAKPLGDASFLTRFLPASIKAVVFDGNCANLYAPIVALAQDVTNGSFPNLESFEVTGKKPSFMSGDFESLEVNMADVGVFFEVRYASHFSHDVERVV